MKDIIIAFIHQYAVWGILLASIFGVIVLHCMYRQMRKLNRSLGLVTAKVQQYFDIIMKEEEEEEETDRTREVHTDEQERRYRPREEDYQLTRGEREMLLSERPDRKKTKRQEEVLDAVLQEYFS